MSDAFNFGGMSGQPETIHDRELAPLVGRDILVRAVPVDYFEVAKAIVRQDAAERQEPTK